MIVELRQYRLVPGELHHYIQLYKDEGFVIQSAHLGQPLGYYTPVSGNQNEVTHLWQYQDHIDRGARRKALFSDQAWLNFIKKTKPLILDMQSNFMDPVELGQNT